jgi:hypothetical protein
MATAMARSSGFVGTGFFAESFARGSFEHYRSGVRYRVDRHGDEAFFEFDLTGIHGRRRLEYFVGSGTTGRSYIWSYAGFLYEAPVSYYSSEARWGISPGYEQIDQLYLTRAIRPACLECHASRLQPLRGTENGFAVPPFLENGVGCERCHGPGEVHVRGAGEIVNPAKLEPKRRESICAQCHLTGEVRIVHRGHEHPFRPGERFTDHETAFVRAGGGEMKVNSHFEKIAQSGCRKASGQKLWCGTCHDPHGAKIDVAGRCVSCHKVRKCHRGDDCVTCHMPKRAVRDVEHAVYTDHSIPRRQMRSKPTAAGATLVAFGGGEASDRDLGLAYAAINGLEERALSLLEKAEKQHPDDLPVLVQLGYLYDRKAQEEKAMALYERALRLDPAQETAAANLASAWIKRGRAEEASRLWRDALSRNPALEPVRINLASAQYRAGDRRGARETLRKLLELNPGNVVARELLMQWRE